MARKANKSKKSQSVGRPVTVSIAEARSLIAMIEKSQVPFGESAPVFAKIKAHVEAGNPLDAEDYEHLLELVKKAKDWETCTKSNTCSKLSCATRLLTVAKERTVSKGEFQTRSPRRMQSIR